MNVTYEMIMEAHRTKKENTERAEELIREERERMEQVEEEARQAKQELAFYKIENILSPHIEELTQNMLKQLYDHVAEQNSNEYPYLTKYHMIDLSLKEEDLWKAVDKVMDSDFITEFGERAAQKTSNERDSDLFRRQVWSFPRRGDYRHCEHFPVKMCVAHYCIRKVYNNLENAGFLMTNRYYRRFNPPGLYMPKGRYVNMKLNMWFRFSLNKDEI